MRAIIAVRIVLIVRDWPVMPAVIAVCMLLTVVLIFIAVVTVAAVSTKLSVIASRCFLVIRLTILVVAVLVAVLVASLAIAV